jgi:acyl carrier protein
MLWKPEKGLRVSSVLDHEDMGGYDESGYEGGGDSLQAIRIGSRVQKTFDIDLERQL